MLKQVQHDDEKIANFSSLPLALPQTLEHRERVVARIAQALPRLVRAGAGKERVDRQRQAAQARQIVEDAVELAGIELRRRNVAIHTYVAQRLPTIMADPIPRTQRTPRRSDTKPANKAPSGMLP